MPKMQSCLCVQIRADFSTISKLKSAIEQCIRNGQIMDSASKDLNKCSFY